MKLKLELVFAVALLVVTGLACGELRKKNAVRESVPDFEVSADQLAKEFKENPSSADAKYAGMTLAITGQVDEWLLERSLIFAGHERYGFAMQCHFDEIDAESRKKMGKGKEVTVLGVCMGRDNGPLIIPRCIVR